MTFFNLLKIIFSHTFLLCRKLETKATISEKKCQAKIRKNKFFQDFQGKRHGLDLRRDLSLTRSF